MARSRKCVSPVNLDETCSFNDSKAQLPRLSVVRTTDARYSGTRALQSDERNNRVRRRQRARIVVVPLRNPYRSRAVWIIFKFRSRGRWILNKSKKKKKKKRKEKTGRHTIVRTPDTLNETHNDGNLDERPFTGA